MKKDAITKYYENVEMDFLLNTCFTYQDYYVISDAYSFIILNESNGLEIKTSDIVNKNMGLFNEYHIKNEYKMLDVDSQDIDDNYGINNELLSLIINVINPDEFYIMEHDSKKMPILKVINTKTGEFAFLPAYKKLDTKTQKTYDYKIISVNKDGNYPIITYLVKNDYKCLNTATVDFEFFDEDGDLINGDRCFIANVPLGDSIQISKLFNCDCDLEFSKYIIRIKSDSFKSSSYSNVDIGYDLISFKNSKFHPIVKYKIINNYKNMSLAIVNFFIYKDEKLIAGDKSIISNIPLGESIQSTKLFNCDSGLDCDSIYIKIIPH